MRVTAVVAFVISAVLLPSAVLADGQTQGQIGVGAGFDKGLVGATYEFQGEKLTPQVGLGFGGLAVGGNYYLTDKTKGDMPAGWRAQATVGVLWEGAFTATATMGQRIGNWDWGVGLLFLGDDDADTLGLDLGSGVTPVTQWSFRF